MTVVKYSEWNKEMKGMWKTRKIESFDHRLYLIILFVSQKRADMVFCYQNCSDLLWEKSLKFKAEGNFWDQ